MITSIYMCGYIVCILSYFVDSHVWFEYSLYWFILIVLSVFIVYIVLRLWYSVVDCSSVCRRRKCLFDITFFLQPQGGRCEIALGLRPSFKRRKPLCRCAIIVGAVFGDFLFIMCDAYGYSVVMWDMFIPWLVAHAERRAWRQKFLLSCDTQHRIKAVNWLSCVCRGVPVLT